MLRPRTLTFLSAALAVLFLPLLGFPTSGTDVAQAGPVHGPQPEHRLTVGHADDRRKTIEVIGWSHEILSPRDAASGLPTGKRQHGPIKIIKRIDESSPALLQSLLDSETLNDVTLESYRRMGGRSELYRTIRLERCFISSYQTSGASASGDGTSASESETIGFTYQRIIWTYHDSETRIEDTLGE